ncbi:MAG: hypothetical protein HC810_02870 [Acaryochloridaceae cyanobacterium RL_2_7]|nr:hypothetical protein [Acaryochloridaceae cyanobacterium RL_2_7]
MTFGFSLAPRYCLIDSNPWLVGIDPLRRYWLNVNGDANRVVNLPGLTSGNFEALQTAIQNFRNLELQQSMDAPTFMEGGAMKLHCVSPNLYAIEGEVDGKVWHLFDAEAIEAFLMTAHPDWQCAPQDIALGQAQLSLSWQMAVA